MEGLKEEFKIDESLKDDLYGFENFLKKLGFKRLEGSIYGLLVLVEKDLSAEEIQQFLDLSQSAVSNAIKTLLSFNALTVRSDRERGCRLYQANEDCLNIVSNVFRKREQNLISDYKKSVKKLKKKAIDSGESTGSLRMRRFDSIISVSELGETVLKFIMSLDEMDIKHRTQLQKITNKLPKFFELLVQGPEITTDGIKMIKGAVGSRVKGYIGRMTGE